MRATTRGLQFYAISVGFATSSKAKHKNKAVSMTRRSLLQENNPRHGFTHSSVWTSIYLFAKVSLRKNYYGLGQLYTRKYFIP
jgi:hypothetical protein